MIDSHIEWVMELFGVVQSWFFMIPWVTVSPYLSLAYTVFSLWFIFVLLRNNTRLCRKAVNLSVVNDSLEEELDQIESERSVESVLSTQLTRSHDRIHILEKQLQEYFDWMRDKFDQPFTIESNVPHVMDDEEDDYE
jgi:hypothetical protein